MGQRLKKLFSKSPFGKNNSDSRSAPTTSGPSNASISDQSQQSRLAPNTTNVDSGHHEPTTGSTVTVESQTSLAPETSQSVPSEVQPSIIQATSDAANPVSPGQLWTDAYNAIQKDNPKMVTAYKKILLSEIGHESNTEANQGSETNQTDAELTHTRAVQLVKVHLENTSRKTLTNQKVEAGMRIASSVKELVSTALKEAPEAATAWGGVCILLKMLENPIKEAKANRDGMVYVLSRMDWYWHLSDILFGKVDKNTEVQSELSNHIVTLYGEFLTYQMKSICLSYRNRLAVFLRDIAQFDDWAGAVKAIRDAEAAVQRDIDTYCTYSIKSSLDQIAKRAELQFTGLQSISQAIQENSKWQEERRQDDDINKCLSDLRITDPRHDKKRIEDSKGGLLRDSYRWILENEDFERWWTDVDNQLLWIKGDPGKGKTMLLCGIIDELKNLTVANPSLSTFFFCQAADGRLNNATAILRGLIYLLVDQWPPLAPHIQSGYDRAGKALFEDVNAWVALSEILTKILLDPNRPEVILIIDGLDECTGDLSKLLDLIVQLFTTPRSKWILSSRNNQLDIEAQFDQLSQKLGISLELNAESISNAVHVYIQHKVDQLTRLKGYSPELRGDVMNYLNSKANDTFLWVSLVCQALANPGIRLRHTRAQLYTFPPGLNSLYDRMMEIIDESIDVEHCKQILAVALVVYRPLTIQELSSLIELPRESADSESIKDLVELCGSFLTLQGETILFVHQSAKDYFQEVATSKISADTKGKHHEVFSRSLQALSRQLRRNMYELDDWGIPTDQITPPTPDPLAATRYSCIHWVDHLSECRYEEGAQMDDLRDGGSVDEFLRKNYLHWLEALSIIVSVPEGIRALLKLKELLQGEETQLASLVWDATQFLQYNKSAIESSPLQVYASALVFSPTQSVIRKLFQNEEPQWLSPKPAVDKDWKSWDMTFEGHHDYVTSVAFSPDGRRLASASRASWGNSNKHRMVKVWDVATGACESTMKGIISPYSRLTFSPDGNRLVLSHSDGLAGIWNVVMGTLEKTFRSSNDITSTSLSPDGKRIALGLKGGTIETQDIATGASVATYDGHEGDVMWLAFSPDGERLASRTSRAAIIWDTENQAAISKVEYEDDYGWSEFQREAFSPDKRWFALVLNEVKTWDAITGAYNRRIEVVDEVLSITFLPITNGLAVWHERAVTIWDVARGTSIRTIQTGKDYISSIAFSPDEKRLALGYIGIAKTWDLTRDVPENMPDSDIKCWSVGFSSDRSRVVSGLDDGRVMIWDAVMGECIATLEAHGCEVESVAFSPDSRLVASNGVDWGGMKVWNAVTGECMAEIEAATSSLQKMAFSPDSRLLAYNATHPYTLKVWDAATGECTAIREHDSGAYSITFSPDSRLLASASSNGTIRISNIETRECIATLKGRQDDVVESLAFSPDSRLLIAGSRDKTARIWDTETSECIVTLEDHDHWVILVVFSPDGSCVATATREVVKIWDVATRELQQIMKSHAFIYSVAFSPGGSYLITNGGAMPLSALPKRGLTTDLEPHDGGIEGGYVGIDGEWVTHNGRKLLWVPHDYRPRLSENAAFTVQSITVCTPSGRVWTSTIRNPIIEHSTVQFSSGDLHSG